MSKYPKEQVPAEDFTRNSNKFVRSLRTPQQMMRYTIIENKTKNQSLN